MEAITPERVEEIGKGCMFSDKESLDREKCIANANTMGSQLVPSQAKVLIMG